MATVSVIIPTFNRAATVRQAVESARAQTRPPDEIIVVDDGSTDATQEVLRPLSGEIRCFLTENGGPSAARNVGIRAAQSDWLAFLDSDDQWDPRKLDRQLRFLETSGFKVCFTGFTVTDGTARLSAEALASRHPDLVMNRLEGEETRITDPVELIAGMDNLPLISSMVADRRLVEKAGLFDESLYAGEDTRLIYNLALLSPVGILNAPLLHFNRDPHRGASILEDWRPATALKKYECYLRVQCEIYWRLFATARPERLKVIRERIGYYMARRAELACGCGEYRAARTLARDALLFARRPRVLAICAGALLMPGVMGRRCRRKYASSWDVAPRPLCAPA